MVLSQYAGKWYEVALTNNPYQLLKQCVINEFSFGKSSNEPLASCNCMNFKHSHCAWCEYEIIFFPMATINIENPRYFTKIMFISIFFRGIVYISV